MVASRSWPGVGDTLAEMAETPEIDVATLATLREQGALLIDVRETHEYAAARVPGVLHIPMGDVVERIDEVPTEGTVYVICASGGRSARVVAQLRAGGIDAVNVVGGTVGWINAGLPVEADTGHEAGSG